MCAVFTWVIAIGGIHLRIEYLSCKIDTNLRLGNSIKRKSETTDRDVDNSVLVWCSHENKFLCNDLHFLVDTDNYTSIRESVAKNIITVISLCPRGRLNIVRYANLGFDLTFQSAPSIFISYAISSSPYRFCGMYHFRWPNTLKITEKMFFWKRLKCLKMYIDWSVRYVNVRSTSGIV